MATKRTVKKAETMAAKAAAKATVKEAAVKPVVKEAAKEVTVKAAETKAETVKAEPAKEPVVKEAAKVTTAAKETEKPAAKKTTARKAPAKKVVAKKEVSADVYVQFMGRELLTKEIVANVKKAWAGMTGKKKKTSKSCRFMLSLKRTKLTMLLMERLTVITSIFDPVCFTHISPGNLMIFRDFFC